MATPEGHFLDFELKYLVIFVSPAMNALCYANHEQNVVCAKQMEDTFFSYYVEEGKHSIFGVN